MHWAYHRENNTYYNGISHLYIYIYICRYPALSSNARYPGVCENAVCPKFMDISENDDFVGIEGTPCSDKAM